MIGILCELTPSIIVTEAMKELLIHDLSIMRVQSSDVSSEQSSNNPSTPPSKPEVQTKVIQLDSLEKLIAITT